MGIATTTPVAIRNALIPLIEALSPTEPNYSGFGWRYRKEGRVAGDLRTFTIVHGPATETFDGIHGGDGIEYEYEMRVRTSYVGISPDDVDDVVWSDGKDLWLLLHPLPDGGAGAVAGLLPFREPLTYEPAPESGDDGHLVIDFILQTHFKASDS